MSSFEVKPVRSPLSTQLSTCSQQSDRKWIHWKEVTPTQPPKTAHEPYCPVGTKGNSVSEAAGCRKLTRPVHPNLLNDSLPESSGFVTPVITRSRLTQAKIKHGVDDVLEVQLCL
jgi:hypothetical protein